MIKFSQCPVCLDNTLHPDEVMNSLSRYASIYICNECGSREAFEGFFWKWQYRKIMYGV